MHIFHHSILSLSGENYVLQKHKQSFSENLAKKPMKQKNITCTCNIFLLKSFNGYITSRWHEVLRVVFTGRIFCKKNMYTLPNDNNNISRSHDTQV